MKQVEHRIPMLADAYPADGLRLLGCARMGLADAAAIALGTSGVELMENAGRAVADAALDMTPFGARILVMCGPGNNGGDGFVAARHLAMRGRSVVVGLLGQREKLQGDAAEMARRYNGPVSPLSLGLLDGVELVVDAVFGAGLNRPIDPGSDLGRLLQTISDRQLAVLAVDVPSGLGGDSGGASGGVLCADETVTFFRRKPGHLLFPGRHLCGRVRVAQIGIPAEVLHPPHAPPDDEPTWANGPELWLQQLSGGEIDQHKYHRGHTVVVSGGIEMSGAARLAARAALRIGSGLVTVAAPRDALVAHASQFNAILLAEAETGGQLEDLLRDTRKNAVVIGPGLGRGADALARVLTVLGSSSDVVLDADAISNAGSAADDVFRAIASVAGRECVLTPHEGEFARLFHDLEGSKLERARAAARLSGSVVVLKGADTVIAAPDGRAAINENAPRWLATAGSGDVLSGMIGGLLGQQAPAFEAACAAVWMHGAAGARFGRGLIAEDIIEELPHVLQGLFGDRAPPPPVAG